MTTQFAPNSMSLPPPPDLDLFDRARLVGWVRSSAVGFRGFANENEAAGAAWIAYRALARRLARRNGGPMPPIDVEPLSLARDGDRAVILARGRPIATLVLPGADSPSGPDTFGFEIEVPPPAADELSMRSLAHRIYRTLRKSGARWAMWERRRVNRRRVAPRSQPVSVPTRRPSDSSPAPIVFLSKFLLTGIAIVLGAAVIATAPRTVTIPIGLVLAAGLVASGLVTLAERWRAFRGRTPARMRGSAAATGARPEGARLVDELADESMRERGWLALGVVSITVLSLAIVLPDELAVAFAAIGLAGLVVFRLTASSVGWAPDRATRVSARGPTEPLASQPETSPQVIPWRSNGAAGRPEERPLGESRDGTSPRLASS
jgi:hypothetical protein